MENKIVEVQTATAGKIWFLAESGLKTRDDVDLIQGYSDLIVPAYFQRSLKALHSDMDGLLGDTETPAIEVEVQVFKSHFGWDVTIAHYYEAVEGFPNTPYRGSSYKQLCADVMEDFLADYKKPETFIAEGWSEDSPEVVDAKKRNEKVAAKFLDAREMATYARFCHGIPMTPGADFLLTTAPVSNMVKHVVSSSPLQRIHTTMNYIKAHMGDTFAPLGAPGVFTHHISASKGTHGIKQGKPFPDCYLYSIKESGFPAENGWCMEDIARGVEAGVAAGLLTFGCAHWSKPVEKERAIAEMLEAGACIVTENLFDIKLVLPAFNVEKKEV